MTSLNICNGLPESTHGTVSHAIPLTCDVSNLVPGSPVQNEIFYRSATCLIIDSEIQCQNCVKCNKTANKLKQKELRNINTPAKKNAPLAFTHRKKIELALIEERKNNKFCALK